MRLYNPTHETIFSKYEGRPYFFKPYSVLNLTKETAEFIFERDEKLGLVNLSHNPDDIEDPKELIARKSVEGLKAYILHKNWVLERFIELDTDLKTQNHFGTVLNKKEVKDVVKDVETATKMIKVIEEKFDFSVETEEFEDQSKKMFDAIEVAVSDFEADNESQIKMKKFEASQDKIINDFLTTIQ